MTACVVVSAGWAVAILALVVFESYLMGWPIGWTDCAPLETGKFHLWQQQHSSCCDLAVDGELLEPEPEVAFPDPYVTTEPKVAEETHRRFTVRPLEWARVRYTLSRWAAEQAATLAADGWETMVLRDVQLDGSPALGFQVLASRPAEPQPPDQDT